MGDASIVNQAVRQHPKLLLKRCPAGWGSQLRKAVPGRRGPTRSQAGCRVPRSLLKGAGQFMLLSEGGGCLECRVLKISSPGGGA